MKKVGLLFVLAMATVALVAQATAQTGTGSTDILGQGIFETDGGAFAMGGDTNSDNVYVGDDMAYAWGGIPFPFGERAYATNNLEIKKNQDSGACACCQTGATLPCTDCCVKSNLETINVGDRFAYAWGEGTATNNVKIVTNQA
jgi:hypothetical protein